MTIPPVPVTDGIPAECMVTLDRSGWRTAWMLPHRRPQPFGEPFSDPRRACQASIRINEEVSGA